VCPVRPRHVVTSCEDGGTRVRSSVIVLYRSRYGATGRYARWIGESTGADVAEAGSFDPLGLVRYDTVLIGSSAYFGRLRCRGFLKRNWHILKEKRTVVFGVTGIRPDDPRQADMLRRSFPRYIRDSITYRPLRGAFSYRELRTVDKVLMSGPRIRLQVRWWLTRDGEAKEMLERFLSPMDWTSRNAADALCRSLGIHKERDGG
jgi:menaquinone-dependent protoporphyrinogen IX oxidase